MITGLIILAKSKSQDLKNRKNKENYSKLTAAEGGGNLATNTFYFIIGILILCLELVFMFFNINIVFKCTKSGAERIINMILAIIIPIPYMFGNILFNNCAKTTLQSNKLF
jgi:hypothetical protein|tara:strand:- start:7883 stop:8215 length:333 start_codon:yes stop_codon:yes gene_type:complete